MAKEKISTNKMITLVDKKYGVNSGQTLKMRLYVLSFKTGGAKTYEDCLAFFQELMEKRVDKQSTLWYNKEKRKR